MMDEHRDHDDPEETPFNSSRPLIVGLFVLGILVVLAIMWLIVVWVR